ncbi:hypothetical protein NP493_16g06056 [Ridgeia piscesae]|uniref:Barrier-to-autointegration factor-like protein n=1 Tax=Ridgeia piscesae TaxID=27915 RepID=A0AAD9PET2_RIDPI|nr:hypothetical protein NP493_16g06056 [Ridgeia piscesae]
MSTDSDPDRHPAVQKQRIFVSEPMGNKSVFHLSGINQILGQRLAAAGFAHACTVLGMYLVLQKNRRQFQRWFCDTCGADVKQANECFECLNEWCDYFL